MFYFIPYFELKMINFSGYHLEAWKLFWFLARVVIISIMLVEAKRLKLSRQTTLIIFFIGMILVSFFEKLLFFFSHKLLHSDGAIFHFDYAGWSFLGRVYFGTLIGMVLAVIITVIITKETKKLLKYLDLLLIAQIGGTFLYRVGNLLNHSHIGKITGAPWGIEFMGKVRHEPTLYELISLTVLFLVAWPLRKKIEKPGILSAIILAWMALSRVITDSFRSDDLPYSNFHFQNGLTLNQVAYGTVFFVCAGILIYLIKKPVPPKIF